MILAQVIFTLAFVIKATKVGNFIEFSFVFLGRNVISFKFTRNFVKKIHAFLSDVLEKSGDGIVENSNSDIDIDKLRHGSLR